MWGPQLVKTWAKTQAILALSTGEAELASVVKASSEALGLRSLLADLGEEVCIEVVSDATAALGMVKRQGLGKVRHLAVADLWCQQRALRGDIHYSKIAGKANPSDMMTKGLGAVDIIRYMAEIGFIPLAGRSAIAPKARNG